MAEGERLDRSKNSMLTAFPHQARGKQAILLPAVNPDPVNHCRQPTPICFCARAYPTVPSGHDDAAALTVLGGVLRNGYLHRTIREQGGAYGGGASQDNQSGAFRFYSPRSEN